VTITVDASALIAAITDLEYTEGTAPETIAKTGLIAPHVIDLEVTRGLRRIDRTSDTDAAVPFRRYRLVSIRRFDHGPLLQRIWDLRHNLTAYDAAYVALAELTGTPLLTLNRKIASAPGHHAEVIVL
jgi:predicted nucleic acid-binding protein